MHNLAESYKRLTLDFSDVQEDDSESEKNAGAMSYSMAKSVLNEDTGDSASNFDTYEQHLES